MVFPIYFESSLLPPPPPSLLPFRFLASRNMQLFGSNPNYWDGVSLMDPQTGEWTTTYSTSGEYSFLPFALTRSYFMPPGEPFVLVRSVVCTVD